MVASATTITQRRFQRSTRVPTNGPSTIIGSTETRVAVASESADFLYKCTTLWAPEHDRTIAWNDPDLAIGWPLEEGGPPQVSAKDEAGLAFSEAEVYD